MEKYIITGATGYLGNNIVNQLLDNGETNIKLLVLPGEDVLMFNGKNLKIAYGNVCDKEFLNNEIESDAIIIHVAGIVDTTSNDRSIMYEVNVNGTKNIADVCLAKKVKKLVYTSSVHTIIPLKKNAELSEPEIFDDKQIIGDYAKTKTMATKYIFEKCKEGLNAVVVYPAGIIGPNDLKVGNLTQLFLDIINKDIRMQVKGGYNFVDVRDVASGVINACHKGRIGEGYILSGEQVTIKQVFEIVNEKLGRRKKIPFIAMWFVKMFASLAEIYYKARNKKPLFSRYSLYTLTANCNFSNKKARTELAFNPRSAKESIFEEVDWLIEQRPELIKIDLEKNKI